VNHILACIDGSSYSESVCDHAAWAAKRLDASVTVVHTISRSSSQSAPADWSGNLGWGEHEALLEELTSLDEARARLAQQQSRIILDQALNHLSESGLTDVKSRQRQGELIDTVLALEEDADLITIGKRGEGAEVAPEHLGRNLERVVRASRKPILVASRTFKPIERFMIAYDAGPSAKRAVSAITRTPLLKDLDCRLLMVGQGSSIEETQLNEAGDKLRDAGFNVTQTIKPGHTDDVIASEIEENEVNLLVMGAYNHSRFRSLIIGSTTNATLRSCKIPVLLFRSNPG
jgi:nucleotide-binding universal stress UspA family protein